MKSLTGKTIFITGASSGIGEALARELAQKGANLAIVARRADRLNALKSELEPQIKVLTLECDVTNDEQLSNAVSKTISHFGGIDMTIANAGYGVNGEFTNLTLADYRRQFEVNVFGVLGTIYATIDALKKSKGHIVIMGSVSGYIGLPKRSAYAMSKFPLRALAQSLHSELGSDDVNVTLISPGYIHSEIREVDKNGNHLPQDEIPPATKFHMETPKAARQMVKAIRRNKPEQIITGHGKITVVVMALFPWLIPSFLRFKKAKHGTA